MTPRWLDCCGAALLAAGVAFGQFELNWQTIDAGGGAASAGDWTLIAAIGQPDAGVTLVGTEYELLGGFWPAIAAPPGQLVGDLNCDGVVSVSDISGFVLALTHPGAYPLQFPGCDILNGDVNGDGVLTVSDIGPFVALLTGG